MAAQDMRIFAEGLDHPEGLAFDADGTLWAGGESGQIYSIDSAGRPRVVAELGGFNLGLAFSPTQELYVCDFQQHTVHRLDRSGRVLGAISQAGGRLLHHPNYCVFDSEGSMYLSDSGHWGQPDGCVYRIRRDGRSEMIADGLCFANGLALGVGEDELFVVESQLDRVVRLPLSGRVHHPEIYAENIERVPDGLVLDAGGNLYVTCYATHCLYRVRPGGHVDLYAWDPEGVMLASPTNAAFAPDGRMFVSNLGRWHITAIDANVPGQLLANQKSQRRTG